MSLRFAPGDPERPEVRALIAAHHAHAAENAVPENIYALDVSELRAPDLRFFEAREEGALAGIGALRFLSGGEGEIKSIHVPEAARGKGYGRLILRFLIETAREAGLSRLWLETGSAPGYAASRALYASEGFTQCPPFGDYPDHPGSYFMTKDLRR